MNPEIEGGGKKPTRYWHKHLPEVGADRRKKPFRRWHKLFSEFLSHTAKLQGRHGIMDRAAAKRAASLSLMLEDMDTKLLKGEFVNPEAYSRTSSSLERVLTQLGVLEPEPSTPKPTLNDLLNRKESQENGKP